MPQTPQSECPLKGGHPPAVKAGGMRITQHKPEREISGPPSHADSDEALVSVSPPKSNQIKQIINGVIAKGDADFPTEAVKAFHENRPQPNHEYRQGSPGNHAKPMMIQQPRK